MDSNKKLIREASHAGSWYDEDSDSLNNSLKSWLTKASLVVKNIKLLKGLIGPHAGFAYSGPTAAWAYLNINPLNYNRVFLLGPCHKKYMTGCGLPKCTEYETPLGNIPVDVEIVSELSKIKNFEFVKKTEEEDEHSLEMHLPFIKKMFGNEEFKLIPIMVGNLSKSSEEYFGKILSPYLKDEKTLFVISSDFCHWGRSFDYTPWNKECGEIHQSIEKMDKDGIELIEAQSGEKFQKYLDETENTICGRHPIAVFLFALRESGLTTETKLVHYSQSSKVKNSRESSVSYASIITYIKED
jgi:AmmeMemoRadiSam system protein B